MDDILVNLEDHIAKNTSWYESGVLIPEVHYPLVSDIVGICGRAKIPPHYLTMSMSPICCESEVVWFKNSKALIDDNIYGFCYTGLGLKTDNMFLMAAAFMRNYISVVFLSVQEVIEYCKRGEDIPDSVLFIPNFYVGKSGGGDLPSWQTSMLLGYLSTRMSRQMLTVIYCEDLKGLSSLYGSKFSEIIESKYIVMGT